MKTIISFFILSNLIILFLKTESYSQEKNVEQEKLQEHNYNLERLEHELDSLQKKYSVLKAKFDSIEIELKIQRELFYADKERAKNTLQYASSIVSWSSWLLSFLGICVVIVGVVGGYFGIKEVRSMRSIGKTFKTEYIEFQRDMQDFRNYCKNFRKIMPWLIQGTNSYFTGNYAKAANFLKKIIALDKEYNEVRIMLAKTYSSWGKFEKAQKEYDYAISIDPNDVSGYFGKGWNYRGMGDYKKAIQAYKKGLEKSEENYHGLAGLGHLYLQNGESEKAKECFERSFRIKPNSGSTFPLANISHKLGDENINIEEAKQFKKQAKYYYELTLKCTKNEINEEPDNYWADYNEVLALIGLNRASEAESILETALSKNSGVQILKIILFHLRYMSKFQAKLKNIDKFIKSIEEKIDEKKLVELK